MKRHDTDLDALTEIAALAPAELYVRQGTRHTGLTTVEVNERRATAGPNVLASERRASVVALICHAVVNPLVILMSVLAAVSFASGDPRAAAVMLAMLLLGVGLRLVQESRADRAAARLQAMISLTASVQRDGQSVELPVRELVPGDVIHLSSGDMVPADVRVVLAKDLFVSQSVLTGESVPVEKHSSMIGIVNQTPATTAIELPTLACMGSSVESGAGTALVIATGSRTYLGKMADNLAAASPQQTAFDRGVAGFTWLMLRFLLVLAPLVFVINGLTKGNWSEAFFFAIAVAVGLTPEMLPMIVTVCLSKGAIALSRQKVIVKSISAIQNLGAMDILCTDKTGTLTCDQVILERHCDVALKEDEGVLALAYMNSHFQTGLKNVLDRAILAHVSTHHEARIPEHTKVDEIPFDFQRRIMSVVVRTAAGDEVLISKGAPEAIFSRCANFELDGALFPMDHAHIGKLKEEYELLSADGFRVLAIASKHHSRPGDRQERTYSKHDEAGLTLNGYAAFLDPPKDSATAAIAALRKHGVVVKVITGDNELVARKICRDVGLPTDRILLGSEVEQLTDKELAAQAVDIALFARISPPQKQRIVAALKSQRHTVGFLGDGVNDALALREADVGISVDSAVDIAKESADLILLEKSLLVLQAGVLEGRRVFANILKYVRMGASSNFGNMFSVLGASIFVPFLPMAPIQILANNLLYDISQTAIPTDDVDPEQIEKPRPWDLRQLGRFILLIGPCSSLFDYLTFFVLLYWFNCWDATTPEAVARSRSLFQTGWFVESVVTQSLIIHIIRTNRIPFLQSRASTLLMATTLAIAAVGLLLPGTHIGQSLGFTPLPIAFWPILALIVLAYAGLTQFVKTLLKTCGIN